MCSQQVFQIIGETNPRAAILSQTKLIYTFSNRCFVPECDNPNDPIYDEPWVLHAVPGITKIQGTFVPDQCDLFERMDLNGGNNTAPPNGHRMKRNINAICPAEWFSDRRSRCEKWVFDKGERTIVNDVCGG